MENNIQLEETEIQSKWRYLQVKIKDQFKTDVDMVNLLYLIGVQEAGEGFREFTKDEKTALMTIGNHKVLSYFGYYKLAEPGTYGWPSYKQMKELSNLSQSDKDELILKGIVLYFTEIDYI